MSLANDMLVEQLPEGWEKKTLEDIAKWGSGGTPLRNKKEYYDNGDILWIKTGELGSKYLYDSEEKITILGLNNSSAKLFPINSIILAMYGATIGKSSILKVQASTNQACAVAQCYQEIIDYEYLYYYIIYSKNQFINLGNGGAQPNISQQIIKKFPILLPSSTEKQQQIVSKIEQLFSVCDELEITIDSNIKKSELLKKSILKQAFSGKLI
jgi:type I restriction enzyme S subunit